MFTSWTTTKEFTAQYTAKQSRDYEFVADAKPKVAEFKAETVEDWPKLTVDMKKYWGSARGTDSY